MKKIKLVLTVLVIEIGLLYVFGALTYSDGLCLENNNWYWTETTGPSASGVVNCPAIPTNLPPATTMSKIKFDIFKGLQVLVPVTAIAGIIIAAKQKKA